jgi:hypothetical protein
LKRQYRTLMKAYRTCLPDSPARVALKADIRVLREQLREASGGTVI